MTFWNKYHSFGIVLDKCRRRIGIKQIPRDKFVKSCWSFGFHHIHEKHLYHTFRLVFLITKKNIYHFSIELAPKDFLRNKIYRGTHVC